MTAVNFKNVRYCYQNVCAVCDVSFAISKNKLTVLVGPYARGKSTIIKLLTDILKPGAYIVGYPVKVEKSSDFEKNERIDVSGVVSKVDESSGNKSYEYPIIVGGTAGIIESPPVDEMNVNP